MKMAEMMPFQCNWIESYRAIKWANVVHNRSKRRMKRSFTDAIFASNFLSLLCVSVRRLVSEFTQQLSAIESEHAHQLQQLVETFRKRNAELRKERLSFSYFTPSLHFITFHFISFRFVSFHFISFHFIFYFPRYLIHSPVRLLARLSIHSLAYFPVFVWENVFKFEF